MKPLIQNPMAEWNKPAFSQVTRGVAVGTDNARKDKGKKSVMGRSVRTERWRYTEWDEGRQGAELYDHEADPDEMKNLATSIEHAGTVAELKRHLQQPSR